MTVESRALTFVNSSLSVSLSANFPLLILREGENTTRRFLEFFTANIRNLNTREAYGRAVCQFFDWCEEREITLHKITPMVVAAYIEQHSSSLPTVKQHLAAIKMLFDWLVLGHIIHSNPASSVRGPKYVVKKGKTPVLSADQARYLLNSIQEDSIIGLRDRALMSVMVYSFARVSAVIAMKVEDYFQNGKRFWFRLQEKGGKLHDVPVHHKAEIYMDAYLEAAGIEHFKKYPLFRTVDKHGNLTDRTISRREVLAMIKRRARQAELPESISCHTFRATGITAYLENGGTLENAQAIANHESPKTTKLYDHTRDQIILDEVERIAI